MLRGFLIGSCVLLGIAVAQPALAQSGSSASLDPYTGRSQADAWTRGNFGRSMGIARPDFARGLSFGYHRGRMSLSSSTAIRANDGRAYGSGFQMTLGPGAESWGTGRASGIGVGRGVQIGGFSDAQRARINAAAWGQLFHSQADVFSRR